MKTYQVIVESASFGGKSLEKGKTFTASGNSMNVKLLVKSKKIKEVKPEGKSEAKK